MKKEILATIITPVYNGEKTIERTIESVLNQTYKNIQYIIVDGKSTDKTLEIIERKNIDKRIKVISEKDKGIYDAMNKGINNSEGEIIGIINADDWYELDAVQKIVDEYKKSNGKLKVFYSDLKIYRDNKLLKVWRIKRLDLKKTMIPHPTVFIPKKIYKQFGNFKDKYKINADWDLLLRLSIKKEIEFQKIEGTLANFSVGGISSDYPIKRLFDSLRIYKENLNLFSAYYYFLFYGTRNYIISKLLKIKKIILK